MIFGNHTRKIVQRMFDQGKTAGEHDLYHYLLDATDMSYDAKAQMMLAWAKRHPRPIQEGRSI